MRGPLERIRRRVTTSDERSALTNPSDAPTSVAARADDASPRADDALRGSSPNADDASRGSAEATPDTGDATRGSSEARPPAGRASWAASEPTPVPTGAASEPGAASSTTDLPAGLDAGALAREASVRRRGRARWRLRFLDRAREVLLRDLGGLVLEIHRAGEVGRHDELVAGKAQRLLQLDAEARELANALGRPRGEVVLREPGLGGTCPRCGELHGSDARFCSNCGLALAGAAMSSPASDTARGATARDTAADATAANPATGTAPPDPAASPTDANGAPGRTQDTETLTIHVHRP